MTPCQHRRVKDWADLLHAAMTEFVGSGAADVAYAVARDFVRCLRDEGLIAGERDDQWIGRELALVTVLHQVRALRALPC